MTEDWTTANQEYLAAAVGAVGRRLRAGLGDVGDVAVDDLADARTAMAAPPALDSIAAAFGLSGFEQDVLLLCAAVELDASIARTCAEAHGDPTRTCVTFGLALAALPNPHWSALAPTAPLRCWHLVELADPRTPTGSPVHIDERVLHALVGINDPDDRVAALSEPLPPAPALPPTLREAAERTTECWAAGPQRVHLHGRHRPDLRAVASAACARRGWSAFLLRDSDVPSAPAERSLLARLCERESALGGNAWVVEVDDAVDGGRGALDFAGRLRAPTAVVTRHPLPSLPPGFREIAVPTAGIDEIRELWRAELGAAAGELDGWLSRIAFQFDLPVATIGSAVAEVAAGEGGAADPDSAGGRLWAACRRRGRAGLDDLAQRIETRSGWDDIVLPAAQSRTLREIAVHVAQSRRVLDEWGFRPGSGRGPGVTALFTGPSGTGKTLAAEVLAGALALDLYRIDLSQVVSKYIGETEKNLRRVFDAAETGGALLLFDEADALFGKRSEVRDSHDRYANVEVGYLLQRMETYRGLAILTTNFKSALDTAFLRRLDFVVQFPFPDAELRAEIWRRVFPERTPTDGLDPDDLARLVVDGGSIRNIARSAAFLAADADEPVRREHVLRSARAEYTKLDRPFPGAEL